MSKTFIGGENPGDMTLCRRVSNRRRRRRRKCVVCSREQFSFQMCLESGYGSVTFRYWR